MDGPDVPGNAPGRQRVDRPLGVPVLVALVAGIRHTVCLRQPGLGHAEAVIVPVVDHHVGPDRHMAVHAGRAGAAGFVVVMLGRVVNRGNVALGAQAVVLAPDPVAVRVVAICANDAGRVHLALQE
jgi:hypothetical protein